MSFCVKCMMVVNSDVVKVTERLEREISLAQVYYCASCRIAPVSTLDDYCPPCVVEMTAWLEKGAREAEIRYLAEVERKEESFSFSL